MQSTREKIKHQVYEIFPTVIYRGEITCHEEFKKQYITELCDYWHYSEELPREELESPENSGRYFLHHNEKYKDFFKCLSNNVREYLNVLDVDDSLIDIHVTKSWVNIHKEDLPNIKVHTHNCSDISFCYYLNCNETSDKLCFHQTKNNNEVSEFMFQTTRSGKYNFNVTPIEGTVVLFPSSLMHSTIQLLEREGQRISICGDVTLTVKENYVKCEYSRLNPSLWRSF
jgi:uncharacterized protein (TIGR02466 family)